MAGTSTSYRPRGGRACRGLCDVACLVSRTAGRARAAGGCRDGASGYSAMPEKALQGAAYLFGPGGIGTWAGGAGGLEYSGGSRACGMGLTTFQRTTPCLSMMNVPRVAMPRSESDTPYRLATSPCGQKSDSSPNWKCSASDQARWVNVESTDTV